MQLPTRKEINPHDDLDGRVACDHFFGKNLEQAEAVFAENGAHYGADLMWMGPVAFRYYVQAAIALIRNEDEPRRIEIISEFVSALEYRLECESEELRPIARQLSGTCQYILENYSALGGLPPTEEQTRALQDAVRRELKKFQDVLGDVAEKDYVDLRPRLRVLVDALSRLGEA